LKEPKLTLGEDVTEPTQTTGEEIDELGFFVKHLGGGELSDKEASGIENKKQSHGVWVWGFSLWTERSNAYVYT
jgi:hypothetical protein